MSAHDQGFSQSKRLPVALLRAVRSAWKRIGPGEVAWSGATGGLLIVCFGIVMHYGALLAETPLTMLVGAGVGGIFALVFFFIGLLLSGCIAILDELPRNYRWAFFAALPVLMVTLTERPGAGAILALYLIVMASVLGAAVTVWRGTGLQNLTRGRHLVWWGGLTLGLTMLAGLMLWAFLYEGNTYRVPEAALIHRVSPSDMADPSMVGDFQVQTLTYGSGRDFRPEYGREAVHTTNVVDGSAFLNGWSGFPGWYRTTFWGFDASQMPLNGLVWYPAGSGPFPLVLIVHGNHQMDDFSETGYAYLGELLASRGYIVVSVDENFLNQGPQDVLIFGSISGESAARGWLLLEHLRVWHEWNDDPTHMFYRRVDTDQIALMGHSMGGEAISLATAFNSMRRFPNNPEIVFDYGYNIRSLVAMAPADEVYLLRNESVYLRDVNYLVLQGSTDADVSSFVGLGQYHRIDLSSGTDIFKSALYIHGANHGQFNTAWGLDGNWRNRLVRNWRAVMPGEDQRHIASLYISAFLEATLRGNEAYQSLFQNTQLAQGWLPESYIVGQYTDAATHYLVTSEEDVDLSTGVAEEITITTEGVSDWVEQDVVMMSGRTYTHAAFVRWDAASETAPRYCISIAEDRLEEQDYTALVFDIASADPNPNNDERPIDLLIELRDVNNERASITLYDEITVLPMLTYQQYKSPLPRIDDIAEIVFSHVAIPLDKFVEQNPELVIDSVMEITFVFDRERSMTLVIDNIGFR